MSKKFKNLIEFLEGPVWNTPIMTFIEVKSAVFSEEEENEKEYEVIFNDYKRLVDTMLGTYLEDMNITPEQFEDECKDATSNKMMTIPHQNLFEQVWAAENMEIFKRMMTQKNIELELQALAVLQRVLGVNSGEAAPKEDEILQRVLQQSADEHEQYKKKLEKMDTDYQKALKDTLKETERLDSDYRKSKEMLEKVIKLSINDELEKVPVVAKEKVSAAKSAPPKSRNQPQLKNINKRRSYPQIGAASNADDQPSFKPSEVSKEKGEIDENTILMRRKYLCEQRDKLVQQKIKEREKYLNEFDNGKRPKSSKAAKSYMNDNVSSLKTNIDPHTLKMRKALAQCLKDELINK